MSIKKTLLTGIVVATLVSLISCGRREAGQSVENDQIVVSGPGIVVDPSVTDDPNLAPVREYPNRNTGDWPVLEYPHPNLVEQGDNVAVTFPEQMFEGVEVSDEFLSANGYVDGTRNTDDSVTIVMSRIRQQMFLDAFRENVYYNIEYFLDEVDYLKDFAFSEDMRYMDIYVDGNTEIELLYEMPYFFSVPFEQYQLTLGQEVRSTMVVMDAETGETLLTMVFPDDEQQDSTQ